MMELQTLQEALKVEIQVHQKLVAQMKQDPQNADLKKQLHELQAKITALSEKQKKVVEQLRKDLLVKQEPELKLQLQSQTIQTADTKHLLQISTTPAQQPNPSQNTGVQQKTLTVAPVLTTKTLPLVLKAATTTMPASAAGQCPTVAMVTAISNMPKPVVNSDSQATPINLQVTSKLPNQGSDPVRIISKNAIVVQAATTTSAQPIKVPQFVPPARATPRPAYLPQVRPKPPAANNVPIAPAPASAPPPPMVAPPHQLLQRPIMLTTKLSPASLPQTTPIHQVRIVNGQPCATVAKTTPTGQVTGIVISAPAPTLQISSLTPDAKTVKSQGGTEKVPVSTPPPSTPPPPPVAKPKREENPQKLAFMVSLGLVTHDHLEEIQSRRQERKRRTTANPVYSGAVFEPERKRSTVTYLNTPVHQGTRKRANEDPLCQILKKEDAIPWPGTLAIVHSYIAYKEAKEEEKQKLLKWSTELKLEREQLEQRAKQLTNSITKCMETKNTILARQKEMQASLEKVKHLIVLIQSFERNQALQPETSQPDPDESSKSSQPDRDESSKTFQPGMEESSKISQPSMMEPSKTSQPGVEESSKVVPIDKMDITSEVNMEVTSKASSEVIVEVLEGQPAEPAAIEEPSSEVEHNSKVQLCTDGSSVEIKPGSDVGSSTEVESVPEVAASSEAEAGSKLEDSSEAEAGLKVEASSEAEASSVIEARSVPEGGVKAPAPSRPAEPMEVSANGDTDSHSQNAGHSPSSVEANVALQPSNGTADAGRQGSTVEEVDLEQKTTSLGKASEGLQESVQPVAHSQTESPK